jgi:hypothetical protein
MSVYAVNGKEPVACWIPSLDTAGNGTTTLTDFSGSNHVTLYNFAMSGSSSNWVADTDAGGVRAVDFDGTNDYGVSAFTPIAGLPSWAYSFWVKTDTTAAVQCAVSQYTSGTSGRWSVLLNYNLVSGFVDQGVVATGETGSGVYLGGSGLVVNVWHHIVVTSTGSTLLIYCNGSLLASTAYTRTIQSTNLTIGRIGNLSTFYLNGRLDDIRAFGVSADLSDVSYLYNAGAGRGRVTVSGESRRRRQSVSGGVL